MAPPAEPAAVAQPCPACGAPIAGRFCEVCGHDSALPAAASRSAPTVEAPVAEDPLAETVVAGPEAVAAPTAPVVPAPAPPPPPGGLVWVATVAADRELYERVQARKGPDAEQVEFPAYHRQRRIVLAGSDLLIGKRSVSQGVLPDIDLGIAPVDIGVSRSHARLHLDGDGITVTDLGSTNGTSLNGSDDLVPPRTPVPLRSGDRIHVGGWTTITITAEPG
jgi:hypothetical protein